MSAEFVQFLEIICINVKRRYVLCALQSLNKDGFELGAIKCVMQKEYQFDKFK